MTSSIQLTIKYIKNTYKDIKSNISKSNTIKALAVLEKMSNELMRKFSSSIYAHKIQMLVKRENIKVKSLIRKAEKRINKK